MPILGRAYPTATDGAESSNSARHAIAPNGVVAAPNMVLRRGEAAKASSPPKFGLAGFVRKAIGFQHLLKDVHGAHH
jgi:hypothetical protein